MTYLPLDDWYEDAEPPNFLVPLDLPFVDAKEIFEKTSFKSGALPTSQEVPLSQADRSWIVQKGLNPETPVQPPSYAAQRALDRHLQQFDFVVPGSQDQWQSYIMYKYFELSLDPDPKISKPALDSLAKSSIVGLSAEKTEININALPTAELEKELLTALKKYSGEKVIEGRVERVNA